TPLMSGFAAPARTTMPTCERARRILLPAWTNPRLASASADPPSRITTSAASPRAKRVRIASGESPSDGPRVVTRWWPLARSKAGPQFGIDPIKAGRDHHMHIGGSGYAHDRQDRRTKHDEPSNERSWFHKLLQSTIRVSIWREIPPLILVAITVCRSFLPS